MKLLLTLGLVLLLACMLPASGEMTDDDLFDVGDGVCTGSPTKMIERGTGSGCGPSTDYICSHYAYAWCNDPDVDDDDD